MVLSLPLAVSAAGKGPLPIADVQRTEPVNFDRDLLPFLNDNCLACHCKKTTKGGLNLETPELMLKGGESGPAIVPKKSADSLVLQAAAHIDSDLAMPPRENKAKAKDLTPEQLGLLKLWIDQGAKTFPKIERVIQWQPLAESLGAIFAVAVSPDGRFAACTRENRLFVYDLATEACVMNEAAHRDQVNALAFHPGGMLMASGGYREVKLWRCTPHTQKLSLAEAGPRAAASSDGHWLATTGDDGKVRLWNLPAGKVEWMIEAATDAVVALAFSSDSTTLACAGADKSISLWAAKDGQSIAKAESPADITALAWATDGQHLATGGADNIVHTWSRALAPEMELEGHTGPITALITLGPDRVVSASADGSLRVWVFGKDHPALKIETGAAVTALGVRPDGQRFASIGLDGVVKLWGVDGKPAGVLKGDRELRHAVDAADCLLQAETSSATYQKGLVVPGEKALQDARERIKKATDALPPKQKELENKQKLADEAKAAKGAADQTLADAEAAAKQAAEFLEQTKKENKPEEVAKTQAENDKLEAERKKAAAKVEPVTKALTAAEDALKKAEGALSVAQGELDQATSDEPKRNAALAAAKTASEAAETIRKSAESAQKAAAHAAAQAEQRPMRSVAFSPDNLTIATAGADHLVRTWCSKTGDPLDVLDGQKAHITTLAFASGHELFSAARNGTVITWNLDPTWKLERTIGTGGPKSPMADRVNALACSHDGKLLAIGGGEPSRGGEIKLWDLEKNDFVRDLPAIHSDTVFGLDFSPNDKFLASGAADKMARVVDLATGKIARTFEGHTHHVLAVSWSPDGRTVATAGADSVVKVWDFLTGEAKKTIDGYDKEVTAVRFAGPTANLVTSSGDNKVRLVSTDGKEVRQFPEVADFMQSAAVTINGKTVVAGGQDGVLRVWNAADGVKLTTFGPAKK